MKHIIVLLGIPGSGKGTEARLLKERYGYQHISTGDLLRALESDPHGDLADKAKLSDMKAGRLVDDSLIYKLAFAAISSALDAGSGVVLDGAIRSVDQAKAYDAFFASIGKEQDVAALVLELTDDLARKRLLRRKVCSACGHIMPYTKETEDLFVCPECQGELVIRKDDNEETIEKRLRDQGNTMLSPIVAYYQDRGILLTVDGSRAIDVVDVDVRALLEQI
jgi:adenylate kinase